MKYLSLVLLFIGAYLNCNNKIQQKVLLCGVCYNVNNTLAKTINIFGKLGSFFEDSSYTALPSINSPSPEGMRYFSGGYNTFLYGTNRNFNFNAIQLEFPFPDLRDTAQSRNTFSSAFVSIIQDYIETHTGMDILTVN